MKALLQLLDGLQACFPQDATKPGVTVSWIEGRPEPFYVSACRYSPIGGLFAGQRTVEASAYGKNLAQAITRCAKDLATKQGLLKQSDQRVMAMVALAKKAR